MILSDAKSAVQQLLGSEPYDHFFAHVVGREPLFLHGGDGPARTGFLGRHPSETLLDAYATHAATLTCHAHSPLGPPPATRDVPDAARFDALIGDYHALGYTVRLPDVVPALPTDSAN